MSLRRENGGKIFSKCKKRIYTTIISHINSNESNNLNTSNSDNVIVTPKFPHGNVQNFSSFNTHINLQKSIHTESLRPTLLR